MPKVIYLWKGPYPWDVRVEKVCKALRDAGNEIHILARWGNETVKNEIIDGLYITRAGFGIKQFFSLPISINILWKNELNALIDKIKPSLIIVREIMLGSLAGKAARQKGIPVIMDMAENYPAAMRDWKKYNKSMISKFAVHKLKLPDAAESSSVRLMNGIITVCDEQNDRLSENYGFSPKDIVAVHNTPPKQLIPEEPVINREKPLVFGHHGNLTAEKDIGCFIKGFLYAAQVNNKLKLIISGKGESYKDVEDIVTASKMRSSVELKGRYDYKALPAIIANVDIGAVPYQISDFNNYTLHNKIFDYFAFGKPVIVSRAKPLVRVINETGAGVIADCTDPDKIKETIENLTKTNIVEMAHAAHKAALDKYNWDVDSKKLIGFIRRYLN
ncbi:MAG: glycosyltransferase [Candidatus Kapaibacterium sp.]